MVTTLTTPAVLKINITSERDRAKENTGVVVIESLFSLLKLEEVQQAHHSPRRPPLPHAPPTVP